MDWYAKDFYRQSPSVNPAGPTGGSRRVIRGGNCLLNALYCRSAYRLGDEVEHRYYGLGFRVARVPAE